MSIVCTRPVVFKSWLIFQPTLKDYSTIPYCQVGGFSHTQKYNDFQLELKREDLIETKGMIQFDKFGVRTEGEENKNHR